MIKRFSYGGKWDNESSFIDMVAADAKTANKKSHPWAKSVWKPLTTLVEALC